MKAIELLNKMLFEGWDNSQVQTTDFAQYYTCATDFARDYAGCGTVLLSDKTMKKGFNNKGTYALVWVKNDSMNYEDEFFHKADFIGSVEGDETIYFFHLS